MTQPLKDSQELKKDVMAMIGEFLKKPPGSFTAKSTLRDELGVDSFGMFELTFQFQEKYKIDIPEEDLRKLITVEDIVSLLEEKLGTVKP